MQKLGRKACIMVAMGKCQNRGSYMLNMMKVLLKLCGFLFERSLLYHCNIYAHFLVVFSELGLLPYCFLQGATCGSLLGFRQIFGKIRSWLGPNGLAFSAKSACLELILLEFSATTGEVAGGGVARVQGQLPFGQITCFFILVQ